MNTINVVKRDIDSCNGDCETVAHRKGHRRRSDNDYSPVFTSKSWDKTLSSIETTMWNSCSLWPNHDWKQLLQESELYSCKMRVVTISTEGVRDGCWRTSTSSPDPIYGILIFPIVIPQITTMHRNRLKKVLTAQLVTLTPSWWLRWRNCSNIFLGTLSKTPAPGSGH